MEEVLGQSGRRYAIERLRQDKDIALGRVYFASHGHTKFVLKEIPQDFDVRIDIYRRVGGCPHVRALSDTVPERRMFVFQYLGENLLQLAQKNISITRTKQVLKCALLRLAAMHEQDIIHNDVKANNILIDLRECATEVDIEQVQLADLEDAAYIPSGTAVMGSQVGNWMWRSPEAHAQGPIEKPSDMFSFGVVCIYAMTHMIIFAVDESKLSEDVDKLAVVLERQISYFADEDGLDGLLKYIGDKNPWGQIFRVIKGGFGKEQPRRPFTLWEGPNLDDDFKDLINGLMNFNPAKRLTAQQALRHRWFGDM